ncbi:MAG: hypothetical protein PUA70_01570 [Oribacterium sp.]|nr:hypothetical protein [Oribacterium sp.]
MIEEKKQRPQEKWDKKNGYITKGFKMYRSLADEFKTVCESQGKTQAEVITKLMREFIEQHKE